MQLSRFAGALCAAASLIALTTQAQAQTAPAQAAPDAASEVVVTGSRTISNGNASPTPVSVVQTNDLQAVQPGTTLADQLNLLPEFSGSKGPASNPTVSGSQTGGDSAANNLNLRNLGINRTLILMDGYRVPPTTFNNGVDVDIIPQMFVQRVDVVTGGVSAVYGSDAVAGVVNYIIDKKFVGLKLVTDAGVSQRGDDQHQDVGIAFGRNFFDGRGHLEASYQFLNSAGIPRRSDRPAFYDYGILGSGTAASPASLAPNITQSGFPFGGLVASGTYANDVFSPNGSLSPFVQGSPAGAAAQTGGGGGYYNSTLIAPEQAHQLFVRYDQDITADIHGYVQISGDLKRNEINADNIKLSKVTLSQTNPYLPAPYNGAMGGATFTLSELMANTGYNAISKADQWIFQGGFTGKWRDYNWGVNYDHGVSNLNTTIPNNENMTHLSAALDAVQGPNGPVCYAATVDPADYAGCVPLNVFGQGAPSAAALAYVEQPTWYKASTGLDDVTGHIEGSPISDWAGPVTVALSAEYRRLSFSESTDAPSNSFMTCNAAVLRYNCSTSTLTWLTSFGNEPTVSNTTTEGAVEVNVPLLRDKPFFEDLSINTAARYTAYSTSGDYWTWKVGGDWKINGVLRLRATQSRDIRAPTLYELFAPPPVVLVSPTDLLTGKVSTNALSPDLSNKNLKAEIGDTTTAGFVVTPISHLSLSVDAYRITISNAITDVSGSTTAYQQACYASGGSSIWCTLQVRPLGSYTNTSAANTATTWYNEELNLSKIDTYGADFEGNYSTQLFNHPAMVRVLAAYQPHAYYEAPGTPTIDQGGAAFGPTGYSAGAVWRLTGFFRVQPVDHFTLDVMERWRNPMKLGGDPTVVWAPGANSVPAFGTTNLTLTYEAPASYSIGQTQVYFNISNLFDAQAPPGEYSGNGARSGLRDGFVLGDDIIGRAFTIGAKLKL